MRNFKVIDLNKKVPVDIVGIKLVQRGSGKLVEKGQQVPYVLYEHTHTRRWWLIKSSQVITLGETISLCLVYGFLNLSVKFEPSRQGVASMGTVYPLNRGPMPWRKELVYRCRPEGNFVLRSVDSKVF